MNKKNIIAIAVLLLATILNAKALKIPSKNQIINMIKNNGYSRINITGIQNYSRCDKVSIRSVKILKIYNGGKLYLERNGQYISSHFTAKIKATGTCTFSKFHNFRKDLDGDGYRDYIAGTLPIMNIPLKARFIKYSGRWRFETLGADTNLEQKYIKNHIRKLFIKGKRATGNKYLSRVIINNIPRGSGNGRYYDRFAVSNKGYSTYYNFIDDVQVIRNFGAKYRSAKWDDLVYYSRNKGSVVNLFRKLGIRENEGVLISLYGGNLNKYAAVNCTKFNKSKYYLSRNSRKLRRENICLAYIHKRLKNRLLAYSNSAVTQRKNQKNYIPRKKITKKRYAKDSKSKKSKKVNLVINDNKIKEIVEMFLSRPKAHNLFYQKNEATRFKLFKYIYEKKTKAERKKAFLYVANGLESGKI